MPICPSGTRLVDLPAQQDEIEEDDDEEDEDEEFEEEDIMGVDDRPAGDLSLDD